MYTSDTSANEEPESAIRQIPTYAGLRAMTAKALKKKRVLLRNSNFRLIYVPDENDGEKQSMRIVTPALDQTVRRHTKDRGYFTVSHLWGPEEEWEPWTNHGIIGLDGQIVQVRIRPEKQDVLVRLLRSNPGFWWIDVFCVQSDTPLSIMGDVYRFCDQCFALVDFPSSGFQLIEAITTVMVSAPWPDAPVKLYEENINGKMGSADRSWHEILGDLIGGWYDGDPADIKALADFLDCRWFTRVWTLQEYLLPPKLTFISEADPDHYGFDRSTMIRIMEILHAIACMTLQQNLVPDAKAVYQDFFFGLSSDQREYASSTPGLSTCYFDLLRLDAEITSIMAYRYRTLNLDILILVLSLIARLPRTCMYARDYIYGVCGLLDINVPLLDNDEEVWASFRKAVQKRAPSLDIPEASLLSGATNMQDVYEAFVELDIREFLATASEYDSYLL